MKYYAKVEWHIEDIQALRPEWTDLQAHDFLLQNETRIQDRLVELGWGVIEELLALEQIEQKEEE